MVKESSYRLSSDVKAWEQEVNQKLHEEHPYLPEYDITVSIRKTDEQSGTGVGQITIDDTIRIPVIIKDYKLQPLDLMYYNGKLLPVSKRSLDNITHKGSIGKAVKPSATGGDMGLRTATQAPNYGKYAYASVSSDNVADALSAAYKDDSGLRYDLHASEHFRNGVAKLAQQTKVASVEEKVAEVVLELVKQASLVEVTEGGVVTVGDRGVICKLATFDGKVKEDTFYVSQKGAYARTGSVAGYPAQVKLASAPIKGAGVFTAEVNGTFVCTEPFSVLCKTASVISVETMLGQKLDIQQDSAFSGFKKIANQVYLSDAWKFTPLTAPAELSSAEQLNKLAAFGSDFSIKRVGQNYLISGDLSLVPELAKIAEVPITRTEAENGFSAYCSPDQVSEIIAEADRVEGAKIKSYAPDSNGDYVEIPKLAAEDKAALIKSAGLLTAHVVKEASVDPAEADRTVDAVLGLNFLNRQNIYTMLDSVDDLEIARAVLSRVLLAGRMGLDVDVSTLRTAVFALDAVIKDLRRVRQAQLVD